MIRFRCPKCLREYVLADAMYGLPLVCKGCGQHLKVPPPGTDEIGATASGEPLASGERPVAVEPATSEPLASGERTAAVEPATSEPLASGERTVAVEPPDISTPSAPPILSPELWAKLEAPIPPPPPEPKPWGAVPPPPPPVPPSHRRVLAIVVDVAVVLVLIAIGVFLGEFLTRKSTAQVLEGLAAPKFPPVDLLLWLAGPVVLLLGYALLGSRGKTVGGWLRRR